MYAIHINNEWKIYSQLPSCWDNTVPVNEHNFHVFGFKSVVIPEITEHQKRGDFYYDEVEDICTYYVIDKTEQEILESELNKYKTISKMDFRAQLILDGSVSLAAIDNAIAAIPVVTQRELIKNQWENAVFYERDNTALNSMAAMLGITQAQLDQMFINGNKHEDSE